MKECLLGSAASLCLIEEAGDEEEVGDSAMDSEGELLPDEPSPPDFCFLRRRVRSWEGENDVGCL